VLVAFTDYVLAYALGDAAQTILLCCWVTKRATRLVTPVRESEIQWAVCLDSCAYLQNIKKLIAVENSICPVGRSR
jgi:hypothetical protein